MTRKPQSFRRRALSIRQPYVEMILRGQKKAEYRNRPTNIRGTIYLYASMKPGDEVYFKRLGLAPGDLPTGVILATVDLVSCRPSRRYPGEFDWILKNPKRLKQPFKPSRQPQPAWFYPR